MDSTNITKELLTTDTRSNHKNDSDSSIFTVSTPLNSTKSDLAVKQKWNLKVKTKNSFNINVASIGNNIQPKEIEKLEEPAKYGANCFQPLKFSIFRQYNNIPVENSNNDSMFSLDTNNNISFSDSNLTFQNPSVRFWSLIHTNIDLDVSDSLLERFTSINEINLKSAIIKSNNEIDFSDIQKTLYNLEPVSASVEDDIIEHPKAQNKFRQSFYKHYIPFFIKLKPLKLYNTHIQVDIHNEPPVAQISQLDDQVKRCSKDNNNSDYRNKTESNPIKLSLIPNKIISTKASKQIIKPITAKKRQKIHCRSYFSNYHYLVIKLGSTYPQSNTNQLFFKYLDENHTIIRRY